MKLKDGKLMFEIGDTIHIDDIAGKPALVATRGENCSECEFCPICDKRKPDNIIARFCIETHFKFSEG